jgi:hypothetical protein
VCVSVWEKGRGAVGMERSGRGWGEGSMSEREVEEL